MTYWILHPYDKHYQIFTCYKILILTCGNIHWIPKMARQHYIKAYFNIDGLVQVCSISIFNTLEILQSCTEPSIYLSCFSPPRSWYVKAEQCPSRVGALNAAYKSILSGWESDLTLLNINILLPWCCIRSTMYLLFVNSDSIGHGEYQMVLASWVLGYTDNGQTMWPPSNIRIKTISYKFMVIKMQIHCLGKCKGPFITVTS